MEGNMMKNFVLKQMTLLTVLALVFAAFTSFAIAEDNTAEFWNPDPDKIFYNAQVVTFDDDIIDMIKNKEYEVHKEAANFPIIDNGAVAIKDGYIIAVSNSEEVLELEAPETETFDLEGKVIIPGIFDTHIHATGLGYDLTYGVELGDATSKEEYVDRIEENIEEHGWGEGDWIRGSRWDEDKLPEMITRWDIDEVTTEGQLVDLSRLFLGRIVNTAVFEKMGIDDQDPDTWPDWWTEDPDHFTGEDIIYREPKYIEELGEEVEVPTGVFIGRHAPGLAEGAPPMTEEEMVESVKLGQRRLAEFGITAIQEPGGDHMPLYQEAKARGWLDGRVIVMDNYMWGYDPEGLEERLEGQINKDGLGCDQLRYFGQKYSLDGGYSTAGAWVSEPFNPEIWGEKYYGSPGISDFYEMYEKFRIAAEHGWSNHVHLIGDRAARMGVDVFRKLYHEIQAGEFEPWKGRVEALEEGEEIDLRWSIIHAYNPMEERTYFLDDVAELGIIIASQPIFNWMHAVSYVPNVGEARMARMQPTRSWLEGGVIYITGTDYATCIPDPWMNIYAMLTRECMVTGKVYGGPEDEHKDETVGVADALATMTILGAYATYDEDWRGSIEVGKVADLAVLDLEDIFELDRNPELCKEMEHRIVKTLVEGEIIYPRDE